MRDNGKTERGLVPVSSQQQAQEVIVNAKTNVATDISIAEQEIREFVQESTKALGEIIQGAVTMINDKNFRIEIEEEISIIEES